jgi:aldehyde dehydrogenase (NAD+)
MTGEASSNRARHAPFLDGTEKLLYIDGRWVSAANGATFQSINPSTGAVLADVAEAGPADIERAVRAARAAFEGPWSRFKPYERQALLLELADQVDTHFEELAALDSLDMGAPLGRTLNNRRRAVGMLRFYAGMATALHGESVQSSVPGDHLTYSVKEPVGVVAAIIPWNSPLTAMIWKLGPALATGCTIIVKPAEEAPLSSLRLAELIDTIGLPPGVVNVTPGSGEVAGAALAAHRGVDKVAFTGSHLTGQKIVTASAGNLKRVSLELGGKSPNIVFADADLEEAVPGAAMAAFANSGQICCAGTRLYVQEQIYDEFVARVAQYARSLRVGDALAEGTDIGPLVSGQQLDRVMGYFQIGAAEGARAICGGERLIEGAMARGYFVPPTVLTDVRQDMRIATEEIFGPVISAMPFHDLEEVIHRGNDSQFGLACGVWTRDVRKAHTVARRLRTGTVWVNCYNLLDPAIPFGGYKMSGYGREAGIHHVDEYLNEKAVWIRS